MKAFGLLSLCMFAESLHAFRSWNTSIISISQQSSPSTSTPAPTFASLSNSISIPGTSQSSAQNPSLTYGNSSGTTTLPQGGIFSTISPPKQKNGTSPLPQAGNTTAIPFPIATNASTTTVPGGSGSGTATVPNGRNSSTLIAQVPSKFEWTAWGDSYASGVGAGNYVDGRRCLRYDGAYPKQILEQFMFESVLNNVVCSGAKTDEVLSYQFYTEDQSSGQPNWQYYPRSNTGSPTMGTLTVGGDDIDFPGILNNCILEGFPWPLSSGFVTRTCDQQRALSWSLISESGDHSTPNANLVNSIDSVIKQIVAYGQAASGSSFRLYVTGYGQFFNAEDPGCDTVTFARLANPVNDGKPHINMTTDLRADFNAMSLTLNSAIQQAVSRNSANNVEYIDIDGMLAGHRFCEPGVQEPDQSNPNLWFYHYPYSTNTDSTDPTIAYLNSVQAANINTLTWDPETTLWVDYLNDFWSKVDEERLLSSAGADSENASAALDLWPDVIGIRAKVFHPQVAYHAAIQQAILNEWFLDTFPGPSVRPRTARAQTAPPTPGYAEGMCRMHVDEHDLACAPGGANLQAEVTVWDANGTRIGYSPSAGIDPSSPLQLSSRLPANLTVTGRSQGEYMQFVLDTWPPLSWTSRSSKSTSPKAYCVNGGWDPREGPQCGGQGLRSVKRDAKNQVDCWFEC